MDQERTTDLLWDGLERVSETAKFLGVSRSQVYKLINLGVLPSVKIGGSRRLPVRAVRELAEKGLIYEGIPRNEAHRAQPSETTDGLPLQKMNRTKDNNE